MVLVWMILFGVILIILILFPFTSVRIHLIYRRKAERDHLEFRFRLFFGWIRFRVRVPSLQLRGAEMTVRSKEKGNVPGSGTRHQKSRITWRGIRKMRHKFAQLQQRIVQLNEVLLETGRRFMSRVVCERLEWETFIGTGDAASTGIVTGIVWGVKYTLIGFAGSHIRWEKAPRLRFNPCLTVNGSRPAWKVYSDSELDTLSLLSFACLYACCRIKKGVKEVGRTPNSRLDDDCYGKYQRDGGCQYNRGRAG